MRRLEATTAIAAVGGETGLDRMRELIVKRGRYRAHMISRARGMRERAALLHGDLEIASSQDGTRESAALPVA